MQPLRILIQFCFLGFMLWLDLALRGVKFLLLLFFVYSIVLVMPVDALQGFIFSDYHKVADVRLPGK